MPETRTERDPLGTLEVPADAYYGVQTLRAVRNFPISGLLPLEPFVLAHVWIKKAAALTHRETGRLPARLADAIIAAADEVIGGAMRDQFVVDPYQAGAGTSHNMNVNEVLANRANEILGAPRGGVLAGASERSREHGAEHQRHDSHHDTPRPSLRTRGAAHGGRSAARCAGGEGSRLRRHREGRTDPPAGCDADPPRAGVHCLRGNDRQGASSRHRCRRLPARSRDRGKRRRYRRDGRTRVSGAHGQAPAGDHRTVTCGRERTAFSSCRAWATWPPTRAALRVLAIDLSKIASDLRLMVMGPRTGIDEIVLPAVQPGSSIMPGKVNPSIPEMVNQVCFQVIGCDTTVTIAAEHGQLELNVMMPVIALQRPALAPDPHQRDLGAHRALRERDRGAPRHVRVLGRAFGRPRHRTCSAHRLRCGSGHQQAFGEGRDSHPRTRAARPDPAARRDRRRCSTCAA